MLKRFTAVIIFMAHPVLFELYFYIFYIFHIFQLLFWTYFQK